MPRLIQTKRNIIIFLAIIILGGGTLAFIGKDVKLLQGDAFEPYEVESCGVERWSVKVFSDADASSININPVNTTLYGLITITTPTPNSNMPRQACEKQVYTIHCRVNKAKLESDGDYHLLLADSAGHVMIGEIADPNCTATQSSLYYSDIKRVRSFFDAHYNVQTSFTDIGANMIITGVTFVDPPHGQTDEAPNHIELHSILDIQYEPVHVHNSGIAENTVPTEHHISLYPDPVRQDATFRIGFGDAPFRNQAFLNIYDIRGKEMMHIAWPKGQNTLDFNRGNLPAGYYFYRLADGDDQVAFGKFLVQ